MGDQQEPQDAAEAFEQLRREVAELGVQIERLPTRMRGKANAIAVRRAGGQAIHGRG